MKKNTLHYLGSINCINVCIRDYNCCQTGIELSKCVYLASGHIIGGQNQFSFQNAYLMIMQAETWATNKVKIVKIYGLSIET